MHLSETPRLVGGDERRLSATPQLGRTIQGLIAPWAHPVLDAYHGLQRIPPHIQRLLGNSYLLEGRVGTLNERQIAELAASTLIGIWLVARVYHERPISFADAEQWFLADAYSQTAVVDDVWPTEAVARQLEHPFESEADPRDLLPHVMEVFHTGPVGTSRAARHHTRNNRRVKRRDGVFYTPADVAHFIASETLRDLSSIRAGSLPAVLDPACGTGVILAASYDVLCEQVRPSSWREAAQVAAGLYGVDINALATGAAALVLVERVTRTTLRVSDPSPLELWREIGRNLAVLDSTELLGRSVPMGSSLDLFQPELAKRLEDVFPSAAAGFDVVIGNPPYAYTDAGGGSTATAFVPFVEMMWRLTRDGGAAGMVLPLSIAYNSNRPLVELRHRMRRADGKWRFCFFDRTPDSLFGDDVKTRNAIAFLSRTGPGEEFGTTGLLRWSSGSRSSLFRSIEFTAASVQLAQTVIPKLGTATEVAAYRRLRLENIGNLGMTVRPATQADRGNESRLLHLGTTAYNWIPVYRELAVAGQAVNRTGLWTLACTTADDADAAFAVLCSQLLYWLWRVEGDGFHLPKGFIKNAPISLDSVSEAQRRSLMGLGQELWQELVKNPVHSTNSGKSSISFSPLVGDAPLVVGAIDVVLEETLALPPGFSRHLQEFVGETIAAGRGPDHDRNPKGTTC
jgi:hypothetical protein